MVVGGLLNPKDLTAAAAPKALTILLNEKKVESHCGTINSFPKQQFSSQGGPKVQNEGGNS